VSVTPAAKTPVITPSRLGRYLEKKFTDDRHLQYVGVQGEVTNLRVQPNGNTYFSLKDRDAVLKCVAFAERAGTFPALENGADVIAYGEVKTYIRDSTYQLVATRLELTGVGALHAKVEVLSRALQREGLFADERKRPLPRFPFRVALVGSPSGDGTRDFVTQARERAPHVSLTLFPTAVNGVAAVPEIVRAIAAADRGGADMLVIVRGGGSYEDLFGFNDERVVRALAACATPTVAAIGHERDQPLVELVADVRASTPSKAAHTVLPKRDDLLRVLAERTSAVERAVALRLERARRALDRIEHRSPIADPARLLEARRQSVDAFRSGIALGFERRVARLRTRLMPLERRLTARSPGAMLEQRRGRVASLRGALERFARDVVPQRRVRIAALATRLDDLLVRRLAHDTNRLAQLNTKFESYDPEALLQRGYAIVTVGDRVLTDPADAPPGTRIEAKLARGSVRARVERDAAGGGEQTTLF
jgi:exodeoxyribonuclease VII large subunit